MKESKGGHSEKDLLILSSQHDRRAFTQLFHIHKHKLYSFLLRLTGSTEMAEDVTQDVFLRMWENRSRLPGIENFDSYIFRTARNRCITVFKRAAMEAAILMEAQYTTPSWNRVTDDAVVEKELREKLRSLLEKLPPQQKLVYTLSREYGLKYEEIGRRLDISPATVKNHMVQALRTLREQFRLRSDSVSFFLALLFLAALENNFPCH